MSTPDLATLRSSIEEAKQFQDSGKHKEAEELLVGVLAALDTMTTHDSTPDRILLLLRAETLNYIAGAQLHALRFSDGRETIEKALALAIELDDDEQHSRALHILASFHSRQGQYDEAMRYFPTALALSRKTGIARWTANILSNLGSLHQQRGELEKALECYSESLPLHEQVANRRSIAITCGNIGGLYNNLLQHDKSLEYNLRALAISEELHDNMFVGSALNNAGFNYANLGNYEKACECYLRAIAIHEQDGRARAAAYPYTNLGDVLRQMGRYDESLERLMTGLALTRTVGDRLQEGRTLAYLANLFATEEFVGKDDKQAIQYTLEALSVFEILHQLEQRGEVEIVKQHRRLADLYQRQGEFESALHHFTTFYELDQKRRSESILAKTAQFEQQLVATAERSAAQATKNLLHKVLPAGIADRLIRGEKVADYFESISILFADIVGFTPLAAHMPPADVIAFLNYIFAEYDRIMKKHECQKIKTMGDGYMAVCGAPLPCDDHAERLARAALELMNDIVLPESIRLTLPKGSVFHLRIGLHTGSAFAGIIGEEGFVYDLYSDAVNVAARMESHGAAGRIHCSEEFVVHLQKRTQEFRCEEREEIDIKGKGIMKTFWLGYVDTPA